MFLEVAAASLEFMDLTFFLWQMQLISSIFQHTYLAGILWSADLKVFVFHNLIYIITI